MLICCFDVEGSVMFKVYNICVNALRRSLFLLHNFLGLLYYGVLNKGFSFYVSFVL